MFKSQEDDLVRACSEIKVLEVSVRGASGASDSSSFFFFFFFFFFAVPTRVRRCLSLSLSLFAQRSLQIKQDDMDGGPASSSIPGRARPLREQLLYQLALKKEEEHNLALELAHKSKQLKLNNEEIAGLSDQLHNARIDGQQHKGGEPERVVVGKRTFSYCKKLTMFFGCVCVYVQFLSLEYLSTYSVTGVWSMSSAVNLNLVSSTL